MLTGRRILVTRARAQATDFAALLAGLGAEPIILPAIEIHPPDDRSALAAALERVQEFDWIVVASLNAVRALGGGGWTGFAGRFAAVGAASAEALRSEFPGADVWVPERFCAEALAAELPVLPGDRILLPHGDLARTVLIEGLRARGADVTAVMAYRTVAAPWEANIPEPDWLTFTSSSGVLATHERLAERGLLGWLQDRPLLSIGPVTSHTIRALGYPVALTAAESTIPGFVAAIAEWGRDRG